MKTIIKALNLLYFRSWRREILNPTRHFLFPWGIFKFPLFQTSLGTVPQVFRFDKKTKQKTNRLSFMLVIESSPPGDLFFNFGKTDAAGRFKN